MDRLAGNWPLANQLIASALAFSGYDYKFVFGTEGHTLRHGARSFPSRCAGFGVQANKG
ncbi:MAG: hypothetical protein R2867_44420 [Caldilineaceae bacterium]